ncbi:MAG: aspartate kinase [Candidatus Staskawiczbacteria bacterium]|nr:aspartate kinase [Candidatus Staskawiczbacteria bacterium]
MKNEKLIACKFGGTSCGNARQIKKIVRIIRSDPRRRCIVVSGPGKEHKRDKKITDLLLALAEDPGSSGIIDIISLRFQKIIDGLGLKIRFQEWLDEALRESELMGQEDKSNFLASRGEYWMAKILAEHIGFEFVDAEEFIAFDRYGKLNLKRTEKNANRIGLREKAVKNGIVVPGFYGKNSAGKIRTFSRGGSNISGSIVADCVEAVLYINWTDVSGVAMADPRIVKNPRIAAVITRAEMGEGSYRGADVLHPETFEPLRRLDIPINVRNTNDPDNPGTMIVGKIGRGQERVPGSVSIIAGKTGFIVITLAKADMNPEIGFLLRACRVMKKFGVNIDHVPGGINTLSIVLEGNIFEKHRQEIINRLQKTCKPDSIDVHKIALVCVVGVSMISVPGVTNRVTGAMANAGINIEVINQGSSQISIILGVREKNYKTTVRAIYAEFAK